MALLSDTNTFVPQINEDNYSFLHKIEPSNDPLPLPSVIQSDIVGVINAIHNDIGINKFLFQGDPGTGKTESVRQISRILARDLFMVDFETIIDSKLGQTARNIAALFQEINSIKQPEKVIILFDELDALALDRTNSNDLREMGRATSAFLKGMDQLDEHVPVIATTNLIKSFDKALLRRFDTIVDFNRYSREDLMEISEIMLNSFLTKYKHVQKNITLFRKIMGLAETLPCPGEMQNLIKTSIAFSNPDDSYGYLIRLYQTVTGRAPDDIQVLKKQGFTVREIEALTKVSKSTVARGLKEI